MARYEPYYFEAFPIDRLQKLSMEHHLYDDVQTGGMGKDEFLALKENIAENGLINPIIVEVLQGHPTKFQISMGMNRTTAYEQLGNETIKAVVITRDYQKLKDLPEHEAIPIHKFESTMKDLHPGDDLWKKSVWADRVLKSAVQT